MAPTGTSGTLAPETATGTEFLSPSKNISCEIDADFGPSSQSQTLCLTISPPRSVVLKTDGSLTECSGQQCLSNAGENTPTLAYGQSITLGAVLVPLLDGRDHMHLAVGSRVPHRFLGHHSARKRHRRLELSRAPADILRLMPSVYDAAGGHAGMRRLAHAWHERVLADEVVSHAFSHGFHPEHTERLAAYWAEALGGPDAYSQSIGDETSVVRMHSGNGPHEEMDRRAIACFDQALTDAGFGADDPVRQVLFDYFAWATTTTMARYHDSEDDVPAGLAIPHWSWHGLVED